MLGACYLYRPQLKILRFGGLIAMTLVIIGTAGLQVVSSYNLPKQESNDLIEQYKLADLLLNGNQSNSLHVKHVWEETPSPENKLFFAFSLLKNNEHERGKHLLQELIDHTNNKTEWLDHAEMTKIMDEIDAYQTAHKESESTTGNQTESLPFETIIDEQLKAFKQYIADQSSIDQSTLDMAVRFDVERLQILASSGDNDELSQVQSDFYEELNKENGHQQIPQLLKNEYAKVSLFFGNSAEAEKILVDSIIENSADQEAVTLLTEVYLSGEVQPSEVAQRLPQYHHAQLLAGREKMSNFANWVVQDEVAPDSSGEESTPIDDELPSYLFDNEETLANELTYALIQSTGSSEENADLAIRLSRYHFNKGENQLAKQEIQDLLGKGELLTTEEQYMINTIQYNDEMLGQSVNSNSFIERQDYLQEIYDAKVGLYNSFHTPKYMHDQNTSEESFEHFLSESIRNPEDRKLSIMTIEAENDGAVSMYVGTENIKSLQRKDVSLTDNHEAIEDFTIEKIGERSGTNNFERSIGLVIDTSGSMEGDRIEIAKNSSRSFIHGIKDYEQAGLVSFESSPTLVQDFTNDKQSLVRGVNGLESNGGTNITDALIFEMERLKDKEGHKVLFIFSDGEDDQFSRVESRAKIIDLANRYGISIFAIGFGAGYETLSEVANETGGVYIAAPNEATIDQGFKYIEEMLAATYKITYQLDDPTEGKHIVTLDYDGLTDQKEYFIGDPDHNGLFPPAEDQSGFTIYQVSPNIIYQTKDDFVKVTLKGRELEGLESVHVGNVTADIDKIIDDETVELSIPMELTMGQHVLVARNQDNKKATTELTISNAAPKDKIQFGWATLYADMCTTSGVEINCVGQPTIDHFIYPEGSKMTLTNNESLSFNGASFKVDQSKLFFFKNMVGEGQNNLNGEMTMTKADDHGEKFGLAYQGRNGLSINKLGIQIELNDMTYTAKHDERPGTFQSTSKLDGVPNSILKNFNMEGLQVLKTIAPFLKTDLGLEVTVSPTVANIKGTTNLEDLSMIGFSMKNPLSEIEYDDLNKRFAITGGLGYFEFFNQEIKGLPVDGGEYTLGFEWPMKFRIGLTLEGNFPLGPTGLALLKAGGLVDFTSRSEAGLVGAVGTVANKPMETLISKLNSMKIASFHFFKIDPKRADLLSAEIDGQVGNILSSDWEAKGDVSGKLLGFELIGSDGRVNNNLMQYGIETNTGMNMKGENTIVFKDPSYSSNLAVYSKATIQHKIPLIPELTGELSSRLIPANLSNSLIRILGKAGKFEFSLSTDDINLFK
jgi:VWFA-related protein